MLPRRRQLAPLLLAALALPPAAHAGAQQASPAKQPAADANTFPEAESQAAAQKAAGQPDAQQPSQGATPKTDENAFPEAESEAAAKKAAADEKADRAAASSGAAPGADVGSSSRDKLSGVDLLGDNDSRISNGAGGTIVNPKLAVEDIKVGQQYVAMGNYVGAYDRFKEASTVDPGNADAVFYLAEAARKTHHLDEAATNYKLYLEVQADGPRAKQARKALAQLEGK